jgi:hypothetical protein
LAITGEQQTRRNPALSLLLFGGPVLFLVAATVLRRIRWRL